MRARRVLPASIALAVLLAANITNYYDRQTAGTLAEPIRKEFGLTDTQLGLMGSAFTWIYALASLPIGRLCDRWGRRKLLALGLAIWGALTGIAAIANGYEMLLLSRLGVGIGEAVAAPAGTSWIGDLFPPEKRARALSLFMLGVPVGTALNYFTSAPIAGAWGWRTAMALAAVPALLLIPAILLLPEPVRGGGPIDHPFTRMLRVPTFWWIVVSGTLFTFNMYAIGVFMPPFLSRIHHLPLAKVGIALGVCQVAGGFGGALLAGRLGKRRLSAAALIAFFGALAAAVAFLLRAGELLWALAFFICAYAALNAYYGLVFASLHDITPPQLRATTMSVYFLLIYAGGGSLGPLITGSLSDRFARLAAAGATLTEANKATGLQQAMLLIPILSFALALSLWAGARTIARDIIAVNPAEAT